MNKNYISPTIEIIQLSVDIETSVSAVVNYPWQADEDFEFFE